MNTSTNYQYLDNASIRIDDIILKPWPDFSVLGETNKLADHLVPELLESNDLFAMLWRAKIPEELMKTIQGFPRCLWRSLMELSQLHVDYFLQWSQHCPALIGLMAIHSSELQSDRDLDRIQAFYRGRHERLKILGLPPTREVYRILSKLPIDSCYPVQLEQLRDAVQNKTRRKLMSHLEVITTETLEILHLPVEFLDIHLLRMSSGDELGEASPIPGICTEIADFRRGLGKLPLWPYHGCGITFQRLSQIRDTFEVELSLGSDFKEIRFPKAPVEVIRSSKLKFEALTSVRELFREGNDMGNCIMTYAKAIIQGTHYAYRMTSPERATILLVRRQEDWHPVEIRGPKNAEIAPESIALIKAWLGNLDRKEVMHDFPF